VQKPTETTLLGEIVWPIAVLEKARQAVVAYGYVIGAEESILAGKHDHWAAIQIACYAQYNNTEDIPRKMPKFEPKTTEQKLKALAQEVQMRLHRTASEIQVKC
jgi:hypothetical protein